MMVMERMRAPCIGATMAIWTLLAMVWPASAETFVFDKDHTNISFSWDHFGLSRQSGRVMAYDGTLEFDPATPEESKLEVTMKAASLWTGVEALDRALRSADYFDAANHPAMTFKSTAVRKTGDKTGEVTGDLTIAGVSRPVTLKVTLNFTGEHPMSKLHPAFKDKLVAGFTAEAKILRSEWGVKRGIPLASDEIEIQINTELSKKP